MDYVHWIFVKLKLILNKTYSLNISGYLSLSFIKWTGFHFSENLSHCYMKLKLPEINISGNESSASFTSVLILIGYSRGYNSEIIWTIQLNRHLKIYANGTAIDKCHIRRV